MTISNYRELTVWQRAMDLALASYDCTDTFPDNERFGLTSQIRRSAVSIPSNIAEGEGRAHRAECLNFLSIARGSLQELVTLLLIAERRGYSQKERLAPLLELCDHVSRMLTSLRRALSR